MKKIDKITQLGMSGEMGFAESLEARLSLAKPTRDMVREFCRDNIPGCLTNGMERLVGDLQARGIRILILSGGYNY